MSTPTAATTGEGSRPDRLPGDLLVVVPELLEPAFRLAGTRVQVATGPDEVATAVTAELAGGAPGVVVVHPELWEQVPPDLRRDWEQRSAPLVVPLPADTGIAVAGRHHAVRDLLARSVGYEITFAPQGATP
jgi:vacuolar-type H+-ATPase subunit F/Vma7